MATGEGKKRTSRKGADEASASAGSSRRKVSELSRHIDELGREVEHLRKAARREIEEHWTSHHTDLFPRFLRWQEALGVEAFSVFSLSGDTLSPEPLLTSPNAPHFPEALSVRKNVSTLATAWGGSVVDLVAFALASRDCQVDFRTGVLCVPIVFDNNPRGLVLARVKGLTAKSYGAIIAETTILLDHVREIASVGMSGPRRRIAPAS
jgi:hypothetical protein